MYRTSGLSRHGALARTVIERVQRDQELRNTNKDTWYECELSSMPFELIQKFLQLSYDRETDEFLENCYDKADWIFTQIFHTLIRSILYWFMTQTSINSLLQRGTMFVLSSEQFLRLLDEPSSWKTDSLLDLGAGDGNVTAVMAQYFSRVFVTEMSPMMRRSLANRGYIVLDVATWMEGSSTYDLVSCLNLIDRCDSPLTLLSQAKAKMKPGSGRMIVALPLPFAPYVEVGRSDHKPTEMLSIVGETAEEQVVSLEQSVFKPLGLELVRWTKVPYLCEGDLHQSYYSMFDYVFLLKAADSFAADSCPATAFTIENES